MLSANAAVMNKADHERADVLRAELARLCWLAIHDTAQGRASERLLQARLAAAREAGTRPATDNGSAPKTALSAPTDHRRV